MLNPEKTFQSILRKFKTLTDFEKRKIVFWYDKDRTVDEGGLAQIAKALGERGIKLHVQDNNLFTTNKLLKKDTWLREAIMQVRNNRQQTEA